MFVGAAYMRPMTGGEKGRVAYMSDIYVRPTPRMATVGWRTGTGTCPYGSRSVTFSETRNQDFFNNPGSQGFSSNQTELFLLRRHVDSEEPGLVLAQNVALVPLRDGGIAVALL